MPNRMKEALKENLQDIVDAGLKTTFTQKKLKEIGVVIPETKMNASKIRKIRKKINLSQSVFAKLLNVSIASVRHWEQGLREPSGSTKVLLDLLSKHPHILNYRLLGFKKAAA